VNGGNAFIDKGDIKSSVMIAVDLRDYYIRTHSIGLANSTIASTITETIIPFVDYDKNRRISAGDVTGDPITITYILNAKKTWYRDADGDLHASVSREACSIPGEGWTLTQLPVDDCNDSDPTPCPANYPTVKITHPLDRSKHLAPAYITLSAEASDVDGTIKKVDFYNGNKLIYTETVALYQQKGYVISEPGNYSLTAKATDNNGNVTTSAVVTISVLPNTPQARNILSASSENDNVIDASNDNSKTNKNSKVDLTIAPNPANNILNIYTTGLQRNKQVTISVISSTGVVMKTKQLSSSTQTTQLNVSSLVSGVYIIKLVNGDKILYKQFVKL
jgi:hypothetical protein